jgi:hypothetical protein
MLKLKTIGFLALEKIGDKIVVYSTEIFATVKQAKKFIATRKETQTVKELLSMVDHVFFYNKLADKYFYCKDRLKKTKIKTRIRKHFDSLPLGTKVFIQGFYEETNYFSNPMFSIEKLTINFKF